VPLRGTLTLLLEDPPRRVDVAPGGVVAVHPGTPMQARNETGEEILFFAYGAPPISGNAQFLDDAGEI
jgi:mannose-6-phosphate isomerase-like protein (cupin superfamily)